MVALLIISILTTSFISGVMGMAGGMILMGVLLMLLPINAAMVLHGFTQLCSNSFRAIIHRRHIQWRLLPPYFLGGIAAFGLLTYLVYRPSLPLTLILLGLLPFAGNLLPTAKTIDVHNPFAMAICGFLVVLMQLIAGASGTVLGVFYLHSTLDRHQIVATKAATQTLGHVGKIIYYGAIVTSASSQSIAWSWLLVAAACSFIGARLGAELLAKLSDRSFRRYYSWLVMGIGAVYIGRGLLLLYP